MLLFDPDAGVLHQELSATVRADTPLHMHLAIRRGVADRIAHQVAERARELVAAAVQRGGVDDVERDLVLVFRKSL